MIPAKVIGRVVPAQTLGAFSGVAFLLVQPVDEEMEATGQAVVACDGVGANVGEYVFMAQGREAGFPLPESFNPSDLTVVAIIDEVTS